MHTTATSEPAPEPGSRGEPGRQMLRQTFAAECLSPVGETELSSGLVASIIDIFWCRGYHHSCSSIATRVHSNIESATASARRTGPGADVLVDQPLVERHAAVHHRRHRLPLHVGHGQLVRVQLPQHSQHRWSFVGSSGRRIAAATASLPRKSIREHCGWCSTAAHFHLDRELAHHPRRLVHQNGLGGAEQDVHLVAIAREEVVNVDIRLVDAFYGFEDLLRDIESAVLIARIPVDQLENNRPEISEREVSSPSPSLVPHAHTHGAQAGRAREDQAGKTNNWAVGCALFETGFLAPVRPKVLALALADLLDRLEPVAIQRVAPWRNPIGRIHRVRMTSQLVSSSSSDASTAVMRCRSTLCAHSSCLVGSVHRGCWQARHTNWHRRNLSVREAPI